MSMVEIASKINLKPAWSPTNVFRAKCQAGFTAGQLQKLVGRGWLEHPFPNERSLLFTLRSGNCYDHREIFDVQLQALDLAEGQMLFVGACEFSVNLPGQPHAKIQHRNRSMNLPTYDRELCSLIWDKTHVSIPEIEHRSQFYPDYVGQAGLWVHERYGFPFNPGFFGLSALLFGTGVQIAKGLGAETFEVWIGSCWDRAADPAWYRRAQVYYAERFGAVVADDGYGIMEIDLR